MLIRRKMIRTAALQLLADAEVKKPSVPVKRIAKYLGAKIIESPTDDELSGFVLRDPKRKQTIIGVNANHHPNRRRFTIAHEIGHLVLHAGEELHIDKQWTGYEIKRRDTESSAGTNVDEMEANLFAAELLMPVHFIDVDLAEHAPLHVDDEERIGELAKRYKVSTQALALRLQYLGCIVQ